MFFDITDHPFMAALYHDRSRNIVVKKAAQVGVSEWLVSYTLHAVSMRRMDVLYVLPTIEVVGDFSTTRVDMAIQVSPYLKQILRPDDHSHRGVSRVGLKRLGSNILYLRAASVRPDARSPKLKAIPVKAWVGDEYDELDPRAPEMARKRMEHTDMGEERIVSTPTYVGIGIDREWENTSQQEWFLCCSACGHWQTPTIQHLVREFDDLDRPVDWWGREEGKAWIACEKCGRQLDRRGRGQWVAAYPQRVRAGYHISKLIAPFADLAEVVANLQTVDETKVKEAWNQDLGLPYAPRGGGLAVATLDANRRDYGLADLAIGAVMGVDVGKLLHVIVRAPRDPETGERRLLWAGTCLHFDDLVPLIRRFRVYTCVVDALPETRKARDFQKSQRSMLVWLAYYQDESKISDVAKWDKDEGSLTAHRTRSLDETVTRFVVGVNTLPAGIRSIQDYYRQVTAITRVTEKKRDGNQVAKWIQTGPDHYAHAENYCTLASMRPVVFGSLAQGVARRRAPS